MTVPNLSSLISSVTGKTSKFLSDHAAEILIGAGIGSGLGATLAASVATKNLEFRKQEALDIINDTKAKYEETDVTSFAFKRDMAVAFGRCILKIALPYAPAAVLSAAGVLCTLKGAGIYRTDICELRTAYAEIAGIYAAYRANVQAKYGPEADSQLAYGGSVVKVPYTVENEDGSKTKETENVRVVDKLPVLAHDHGIVLSERNCKIPWEKVTGYNCFFVKSGIDSANGDLAIRWSIKGDDGEVSPGVVSIYEAYTKQFGYDYSDFEGKERTRRMEFDKKYGWVLDAHNPDLAETKIDFFDEKFYVNKETGEREQLGLTANQKKFLSGNRNAFQVSLIPQNIVNIEETLEKYGYV